MAKKQYLLLFIVLTCTILVFYGGTLKTWFQQDEWDWMGRYYYYNSISNIPLLEAFKSSFFPHPRYRFTPLYDALYAGAVQIFGLNFTGYALFGVVCHLANSILAYILTYKITFDRRLSTLASILFSVSSIGQKSVTWVATGFNVLPAAFFSFLALIYLIDYTNNKTGISKIFLSLLIALWFKETAFGVLIFLPLFVFFLDKRIGKRKFKKVLLGTIVFTISYFIIRFSLGTIGVKIHTSGYPDWGRFLPLKEIISLGVWAPLRSFVDGFLFPHTLISLAVMLRGKHDVFAETIGVNYITIMLAPLLFYLFVISYKKVVPNCQSLLPKNQRLRNIIITGIILIFVSTITTLLLLIRGSSALVYILRSRDLYISTLGAAILLAVPLHYLIKNKQKYHKIIGLLLLFVYLYYHYININIFTLKEEVARKNIRKPIIKSIYSKYPIIEKRAVFYIESDTAYYGASKTSLPFQTGFGRTLLVWYLLRNRNIPPEFAKDDYLYFPFAEGYKEINGYGFGYFTNFEKLASIIQTHSIPITNIYAFSFTGKDNLLTDHSAEIRIKLLEKLNKT